MAENSSQLSFSQLEFDEETSVASSVEVSLIIFTNTTKRPLILDQIIVSGQAEAIYRVLFNATTKFKFRTQVVGISENITFPNGVLLQCGDSIEIKVTNCEGEAADFGGTFIMHGAS